MTVEAAADTSVRTSIVVAAPIERAFALFTEGIGSWALEKTSEAEVRFVAEAPDRTRVELEPRNLTRHGEGWEQMRDAVGSPGGWSGGLRLFADAARAT